MTIRATPAHSCVGSFDSMGSGTCIGLCDEDSDCEPGGECNEWAGACLPLGESPAEGSEHGGPCTEDADCLSDSCIPPYETGFTGWADGYCIGFSILPMGYNTDTFYSGDTLPQGTCAGDAVCWPNGSYTRGDLGVCLDGCTSDADCRTDAGYYRLRSVDLRRGRPRLRAGRRAPHRAPARARLRRLRPRRRDADRVVRRHAQRQPHPPPGRGAQEPK